MFTFVLLMYCFLPFFIIYKSRKNRKLYQIQVEKDLKQQQKELNQAISQAVRMGNFNITIRNKPDEK
jgi:hypothetical protein